MKTAESTIDQEINTLRASPFVQLARREQRAKYQKQQRLYQLRYLERRGRELHEAGVTMQSLAEQMKKERESWDFEDDVF